MAAEDRWSIFYSGLLNGGKKAMDGIPTNKEVAAILGIDEASVEAFRQETHQLNNGSWLIQFAYWMPQELRQGLTGSFTLTIIPPPNPHDRRQRD